MFLRTITVGVRYSAGSNNLALGMAGCDLPEHKETADTGREGGGTGLDLMELCNKQRQAMAKMGLKRVKDRFIVWV